MCEIVDCSRNVVDCSRNVADCRKNVADCSRNDDVEGGGHPTVGINIIVCDWKCFIYTWLQTIFFGYIMRREVWRTFSRLE